MGNIPAEGDLVIRQIPFEFGDDLDPVWNPAQREWSHMVTVHPWPCPTSNHS